ncbi:MAG TPA: HAMP domain-containing sensor histidine kinase [Solirubrobacterales bacterium]|jgi:signal transduction histidine kinase
MPRDAGGVGRRIARLRPSSWPVRWRLAGVSAGLTLVILVLFGGIVGNLATQQVRDDFNNEVENAVSALASQVQIADTITNPLIVREPDLGDFASANGATARIFDWRGVEIDSSPNAADLGPPVPGVHERDGMRIETLTLRSRLTGRVAGYVQYGRDEEHVDSTINRIWLFIAAGVLGATLLACLAGLAIARRAMRPISSLTATAREIATTGDPSRHMPASGGEDEVAELAATLEQMLRSLDSARAEREAAMRRQREFVADASHELRTPLTSILANLELLQASLAEPRSEEHAMIDSALRSSKRMSRLVADLLLLARADAGRIGARIPCDFAQIAGEAAVEAAPTIGDRSLVVENERPLLVVGNPDELHRMVTNLLDNAIKHTPPSATIELRLRAEGSHAVLEVSDDGPGIPPGQRDQVFERFVRGEGPADTAVGGGAGSGLGLAIVKAVASSHAGEVELTESPKGGALLRVRIPLTRAERGISPALDRL